MNIEQIERAFEGYEKLHRPKGADPKKHRGKTMQMLWDASFATGMPGLLRMIAEADGHEIVHLDAPEGATGPGSVVYKD